MAYTLIPVTRTYLDGATPRTGTVRLQLVGPLYNEGEIADRQPQVATLNAGGSISLTVRATNDPATLPVGGGAYEVTETLSGLATAVYYVEVPFDGGPVDLATAPHLTAEEINAPSVLFQPVNERGLPGGYPVLDGSGRVPRDQLPTDLGGGEGGGSGIEISGNATDIQPLGTRAAGTTGKAADASHVHQVPTLNQVGAPTANVDLNGKRIVNAAPGVAGTDLATVSQLGQSLLGWLNVKDSVYGAVGDGTTDDTAAIQEALDAAPDGGVVYLPEGIYRTSAPLVLPPTVTLRGPRAGMMDGINLSDPPCYIQPLTGFTGAALILLKDQAGGGYPDLPAEHRIESLMLDGSTLDGTNPIDGIFAAGNIQNVRLSNVTIRRMSNNGIVTGGIADVFPYSWRLYNVMVDNCRGNGILVTRMTDLTMIDCQAIGNWGQGMVLSNIANSQMIGCRAEWNGSHGIHITGGWGNGTGSGGMQMAACSTDRNGGDGVLVDATGNAPISITNLTTRRDGRNGGSGGNDHAGLAIDGATMPVVANTVTCYPGVDDNGTGTNSPQYGVRLSGSTSVQLDGLYLHAAQAGLHDDGTSTAVTLGSNITVASGPTTAPARNVRLAGADWINVKAYGAKGDGATDDTAALQAAITAGAAAKTTVYVPPGTYMVSDPIVIPAVEGLTVAGAGWGSSIKLLAASDCYVFQMTAADTRVVFRDLEIDGNCLEQGTTGASGGIDGSGSVASVYFNLHFVGCRDNALFLRGMTGGAFGHNNRVIGCLFDQSMSSTGPGRGIHLDSNDENQIIGCDFEYLGGSGGSGATAASMIFDQCGTQFISDCNFVNGGNNAIGVRVQDAKSTKITGCNFDGLAGTPIFLAAQRCVVTSNTIFSVGHAGTAGQASGIHLEYATADNIIAHNVITSDPVDGVSRGAIRESGDGDAGRNIISHNTIVTDGTWSYAALDLSGTGSWVSGNLGGGRAGQGRAMPGTLFVAASDAPAADKLVADYVCDGTADNVEIQAAINAAQAASGGKVSLSAGTFAIAAQLVLEGSDDVDDEIDIHLSGAGQRSTTLNVASGVASGLHLTKVVRAHLSDFGVTVQGASHGISSNTTNGATSGHRSFWHSSFKNLQINGPWDGTHSGWGMHLGSPFRSVIENIEMGGIGNGLRMFSEHADFNPGDCQVTRMFIDTHGNNRVAYQVDSTTTTGVMNQIEFSMCEGIASGTGCTGIQLSGTGAVTHTHWRGVNLEQFDKLVDIQRGSGNTFRLNYVELRAGTAGLTAFTFAAPSYNNAILSTGLLYASASCLLFSDANTALPSQPNRVENVRVFPDNGAVVTNTPNPAFTTVRRNVVGSAGVATPPSGKGFYVPDGWGSFWRPKRDAAATGGKAKIIVVGGSSSQGFYASNLHTGGWVGGMRTALQTRYGNGGSGFFSTSRSAVKLNGAGDAAAVAAWTAVQSMATTSGTWTLGGSNFGPGITYLFADTTGASITFPKVTGTTLKIYTVSGNGARAGFKYAIDGGAQVAVADGGIVPSNIQVTTVTGLSAGDHSVVITWDGTASGTSQNLSVCGVSGENASGIVVDNNAKAGAASGSYVASLPLGASFNGGADNPADLLIFTAGPNDAAANVSGDVWSANVAKFLKTVKDTGTATGNTDILFVIPHLGVHDVTNFVYQEYANRARTLADTYGGAVINLWALGRNSWKYWSDLGYWADANTPGTGVGTDSVHPNDAGYAHITQHILSVVDS